MILAGIFFRIPAFFISIIRSWFCEHRRENTLQKRRRLSIVRDSTQKCSMVVNSASVGMVNLSVRSVMAAWCITTMLTSKRRSEMFHFGANLTSYSWRNPDELYRCWYEPLCPFHAASSKNQQFSPWLEHDNIDKSDSNSHNYFSQVSRSSSSIFRGCPCSPEW